MLLASIGVMASGFGMISVFRLMDGCLQVLGAARGMIELGVSWRLGDGELGQVVGGADHRPFACDLLAAAQQELTEAPGLLDLAEHRLDGLLAQAVAAAAPGTPEGGRHGRDPAAGQRGARPRCHRH